MERLETKGIGAPVAAPKGARSATEGAATGAAATVEVVGKARRRRFSAEYKARILREADACAGSGQIGALLRREGLYSSHLTTWRGHRARGALEALAAKKRRKKPTRDARDRELARLARENATTPAPPVALRAPFGAATGAPIPFVSNLSMLRDPPRPNSNLDRAGVSRFIGTGGSPHFQRVSEIVRAASLLVSCRVCGKLHKPECPIDLHPICPACTGRRQMASLNMGES